MNRLLRDEQLLLRPVEPIDLEVLYRWENETTLWEHSGALTPYSYFQIKNFITNSTADIYQDRQLRLMICSATDGAPMGAIDLFDFEPHHARAAVGILVDAPFQQRGVAQQALSLLTTYAFEHLTLHQLYAHIPTENRASLQLFERAGFTRSGVLKEWHKVGNRFLDVALYQLPNSPSRD